MKHFKLDYFSGVWKNHSLHEVADEYKLRDSLFSDYFENGFQTTIGGECWFCYIQNGIKIFVPTADLACVPMELRSQPMFYDITFPRIKIDFSGMGLDWYRELLGYSVEDVLRVPKADFHPTRCDFAVDFVDELPEVYADLRKYLHDLDEQGVRRVCCDGLRGGIKYELKSGDQSTIYLGGTSGDMLLRIYDKRLEYTDQFGAWKVIPPYGDCKSWIRYELQCRREAAQTMLYHPVTDSSGNAVYNDKGVLYCEDETLTQWALSNFRTMIKRYSFRDMSLSIEHKDAVILPFWQKLLSLFDGKVPIIQISHFVEFVSAMDRAEKNVLRYSNSIIAYVAKYKVEGLILLLQRCLEDQQKKQKTGTPIEQLSASLKHNSLLTTLQSESSELLSFPGLTTKNGYLEINTSFLNLYNNNERNLVQWQRESTSAGT